MRHVENGEEPFNAALRGSREVGFTIISISTSLIAVFIPIFFMPGVIGLLFHEFAVVVGLSIVVSAFVSLTLVPMLASRFLRAEAHGTRHNFLINAFERGFNATLSLYSRSLDKALSHRKQRVAGSLGHVCGDGVVVQCHPQGLFPTRRHWPNYGDHRGGRGHVLP